MDIGQGAHGFSGHFTDGRSDSLNQVLLDKSILHSLMVKHIFRINKTYFPGPSIYTVSNTFL